MSQPPHGSTRSRSKSRRAQELSAFLRSRRARVRPADVGLPPGGARRTPGLRREEVAVLAGVGASWYQWLEQGRDITVSPHVLDAVARVLRLNGDERRHLYALAGLNPPPPRSEYDPDYLCDGLQRLMDSWMPNPANVLDAYWNTIALNDAARLVLGINEQDNCILEFFLGDGCRARNLHWDRRAPELTAQLRASLSDHPEDEGFRLLLEQLLAESEEFAALWAHGEVRAPGQYRKEFAHPEEGVLSFETTTLQVPARPDLRLLLHLPAPGTDTAARLARLTAGGRAAGVAS